MKNPLWTLLVFALTNMSPPYLFNNSIDVNKLIYAVEVNGTLCGFSEIYLAKEEDNKTILRQRVFTNLRALESPLENELLFTYHLDETGSFTYHDSQINQGTIHLELVVKINSDKAYFDYSEGEMVEVSLPPDTLLENTVFFPHLVRDFVDGENQERTYKSLEVRIEAIQSKT